MRLVVSMMGMLALSANMFATPITFATFNQVESNLANANNPFGLKYNAANRTLTTFDNQNYAAAAGRPAHVSDNALDGNFTFVASGINGLLPAPLLGKPLKATLSVKKTVSGNNSAFCTSSRCDQLLNDAENNVTTYMRIILTENVAEALGYTNLLTVSFTGSLGGRRGGSTAELGGDTDLGDTVVFTSDFLDFSRATQETLNLALNSIKMKFNRVGSGNGAANLQTFVAGNTVGNFATDPKASVSHNFVPEPASFLLIGSAMVGLGLFRRVGRG